MKSRPPVWQRIVSRILPEGRAVLGAGVGLLLMLPHAWPEEKAFDLFPVGKPWLDVRIPRYDEHDVLTSMMHTESLTRQDEKKLKLDGLTLVVFQSDGTISLRLKTKQGLYDVASSMLQTHSTTFIEHAQFEMTGDRLTFDTSKQQGTLQGNVQMRIFGVPVTQQVPAPGAPAQQAHPEQAPGGQKAQPEPAKGEQPVEVAQLSSSRALLPSRSKPSTP